MSIIEDSFREFVSNIGIIIPVIIITIIGFLLSYLLSHFFHSFAIISNFILGLTLSYAISASMSYYLFKRVSNFVDYLGPSTVCGLILGLFFLIFSFVSGALSLLLDGLALSFAVLLFPSIYKGTFDVSGTIDWIGKSIGQDVISFLILYVLCLLSFYPVIDIVTIPLSTILGYLMKIRI